jgi:hypothetical protein
MIFSLLGLLAAGTTPPSAVGIQPCDSARLAAAYSDTSSGQSAAAFPIPVAGASRGLVAVFPPGPTWSGYLVLATCGGKPVDTVYTGGVDSLRFWRVTGRRRTEFLVFSTTATGSGAATRTLSIVAVVHDSLRVLWAQPYLDYFIYYGGGGIDSASVRVQQAGELLYTGSSQPFHLDSLSDTLVADGPPCRFAERWVWRARADTFELRRSASDRDRCKAA